LVLALLLATCSSPPASLEVRQIPSPAGAGSGEPELTSGADGRVVLSWIEPLEGKPALRYAVWQGEAWGPPGLVSSGESWIVNWADFPSVTALRGEALLAHWLQKVGDDPYAYAVMISRSADGGKTWSAPACPHDTSATEHGFVSTVAMPDGRAMVVWLDGRETGGQEGEGAMTLRTATLDTEGKVVRTDLLDPRVCDCCQTSAAALGDGRLLVAYRDRSDQEIRDISVASFDERWSPPRPGHADGWEIAGCPVNGPSLAALGERVAVAWFTGAAGKAQVRVARSADGGRTFDPPTAVDVGDPLGRVDVVLLDDGTPLVSWVETQGDAARILVRRVPGVGLPGPPIPVATTSRDRPAGFPRMVRAGASVLLAWTDTSAKRVRTAALPLRAPR
jgi:hypothetical protein